MARKRYKKKRADYRKGGRVKYAHGGRPQRSNFDNADEYRNALDNWASDPAHNVQSISPQRTTPERMAEISAMEGVPSPTGIKSIDEYNVGIATPRKPGDTRTNIQRGQDRKVTGGSSMNEPYIPNVVTDDKDNKETRNIYTDATEKKLTAARKDAEATRRGETPLPTIPDAQQVSGDIATPDTQIQQIADTGQAVATRAVSDLKDTATTAQAVQSQDVTKASGQDLINQYRSNPNLPQVFIGGEAPYYNAQTGNIEQGGVETPFKSWTPEQFAQEYNLETKSMTAAQMQVAQADTPTQVQAASGSIGSEELAQAAQVDRIAPIEGAAVEIKEGALTERVTGTISPQAIATAAQAAGTTLSRVTRAKKQLRNSGMSEEAITALGNDPEALEDRLMTLTEQERGVIGDLPEEALVSNQLDSLLKGMENGEIPAWARPAVSAVEQMLAERGLEASSVGRDNLFNAIIQSAIPLAQSNAQAIQASVAQTREIEAREDLTNVQLRQQTALQNAATVFQMDMAQFSADQQTALSNSKFLQTVGITEANMNQQATIQNALLLSQANLAEADFYQKAQIQNAQAFLQMDMANLNAQQQANILTAQQRQQTMLSNQAAQNAAAQFNAASENQTQQFMANLAQQVELNNTAQLNAIAQFNATAQNQVDQQVRGLTADENKFNAQMATQISQYNTQLAYDRAKWNATNAQAVEQSNIAWRRQANTINTAAQNQINMQNAQNLFGMSQQAQAFLWQELRDRATYEFQAAEKFEDRKTHLIAQSLSNEAQSAQYWESITTSNLSKVFDSLVNIGISRVTGDTGDS